MQTSQVKIPLVGNQYLYEENGRIALVQIQRIWQGGTPHGEKTPSWRGWDLKVIAAIRGNWQPGEVFHYGYDCEQPIRFGEFFEIDDGEQNG